MSDMHAPLLPKRRYEDEEEEEEREDEGVRADYGSAVYHYPPHLQHGHFTSLEKLMFFTSSILLILLFVFVGLYARSSQTDDEPMLPMPTIPSNETVQTECHSSSCIIIAAQILQDVDTELDPCDDFYAYTCNKWQDDHSIPDFKSRLDIQNIAQQSIHRRMDQILTHDYKKFQKKDPKDSWKLPDQDLILDQQLFTKLSNFYASCMNQDAIEAVGVEPLFDLFRTIQHLIPLSHEVSSTQLQEAIQYLADRGIWTLFKFDIVMDNKPTLYFSHAPIETYDTPLYTETMIATLDRVFKQDTRNEFGFKYWSTTATARRILEFEERLIFSNSHKSEQPLTSWTIDELQEKLPYLNWHTYIQQHIGNLPVPSKIFIQDPQFIDRLGRNVLNTTNARTLQMYFLWRTMWKYVDMLGEGFQLPKRQLEAAVEGMDPRAKPDRRDICMQVLDQSTMGIVVGRYYVKDHEHEIIQSRDKLQALIHDMMTLVKKKVMDSNIIKKLDSIEFEIGFTDASIESPIELSDYFGDLVIQKNDFFGNILRNNQHESRHMWKSLGKPIWRKAMNPQSVHVQYIRELNKVIIPAGLLQLPFYDANGPMYSSVGTIGQMIGHEIMHGFDTKGRNYDERGNFNREWLNQTVIDALDKQNKCLEDQYNGHGSIDNNFADQLLWVELIEDKENMTRLPGLSQWTKDQLAYIQYSRLFCSKTTKERQALKSHIAPDDLRVNLPLVNSNHFAKVFNCEKGSFMNPNQKKCNVWQQN